MRLLVVLLISIFFFGCTSQEKLPETYGIFVWTDNQWKPIAESSSSIELDLQPEVRFLIHQKSIEHYMRTFEIAKKIYIRNIVQRDPDQPPREVKPYRKWDKQKQYFVIKGQFAPVKDQAEMVVWTPSTPLAAGIYEPIVEGEPKFAFSINRTEVLAELEGSAHCVDLIKTNFGGIPMGVPDQYKPCAGDPTEELVKELSLLHRGQPDVAKIQKLLSRGASASAKMGDGTALGAVVYAGSNELLQAMLAGGASANAIENEGLGIPVSFSAFRPEILKSLIDRGLNVNTKAKDGMTVLHVFATTPQNITMLIDAGADVNAVNKYGQSPLSRALDQRMIMQGNLAMDNSKLLADRLKEANTAVELLRSKGAKR